MKGIVLSGGSGTRLYPATSCISKQLLPVYDKPMVYYPLSTLMLAGIKDILIITTPHEQHLYQNLLNDGSQWGIHLSYAAQEKPRGIADAFLVGENFIGNDSVCLILGDNILYGQGLKIILQKTTQDNDGATVFGYYVNDPHRYGVVSFDKIGKATKIVEKPKHPETNYAVIGLYYYNNQVIDIAKNLKPSDRGELEITDITQHYLDQGMLNVEILGRGIAWLDTGTHESLLQASQFIQVLEHRQALKIGSPEEVAWRLGYISEDQLIQLATPLVKSGYGEYLLSLL